MNLNVNLMPNQGKMWYHTNDNLPNGERYPDNCINLRLNSFIT
jgi:hypothetical protein